MDVLLLTKEALLLDQWVLVSFHELWKLYSGNRFAARVGEGFQERLEMPSEGRQYLSPATKDRRDLIQHTVNLREHFPVSGARTAICGATPTHGGAESSVLPHTFSPPCFCTTTDFTAASEVKFF